MNWDDGDDEKLDWLLDLFVILHNTDDAGCKQVLFLKGKDGSLFDNKLSIINKLDFDWLLFIFFNVSTKII